MFKRKTIFSRLFLSYSFIIVTSLLLFIGVFFYLFHVNLYKEYESIFSHHYAQLEEQLQNLNNLNSQDYEAAKNLSYSLHQPGYFIYIVDEESKQIFGPDPHQTNHKIGISNEIINKATTGLKVTEGGFKNGQLQYTVAAKLSTSLNGVKTPIMVMVFHDLTHEYIQVIVMIILTFIISLAFAGIVLWFISRKITAPLREMNDIAKKYAKGDFSKSVQYQSSDEIGQLAKSFNYMSKELDQLETRRKQFISTISHELRSPLTSIKGFIIALMDGTIPEHRRTHYLSLMKDETERMIKLVNDTLDINQMEEGHVQIYRTEYDLTAQVNNIILKFEPHLAKKDLEISFHSDQKYDVYADKERIEQVFINLLQNAVQFSKKGGLITITLVREGQFVKVKIQDYGEGIPEEHLQLIWRRFYKVDEARTNKTGAGLGLSIVKSILDLHDAEIEIQSKLGQGTVVTFTLPIA